jgi:crotonobetainyl-CoA:carnitine CoA-transferase CaiB-like acyl-CoA transferase
MSMSDQTGSTQAHASEALPLAGLVVLDVTHARAGPTCVRHLADWGAEVIRIESPPPPPGSPASEDVVGNHHGSDYQNLHRNKRSIRLNLKDPEGHAIFMKLAAGADVIIENMRASVKDRLKIAWDDVRKVNPRIVYGSLSGFGQDGPYRERAGVDQIAQGMGGLMSVTGAPGAGPMRVGIAIADLTSGNLLALAVMMALHERERTGLGRWVHTSLLESQIFMLDFQASRWLMAGEVAEQAGNDHPMGIPTGVFPTADGHINIAASSSRMWERLCDAIGRSQWKAIEKWQSQKGRSIDRAQINASIGEVTRHQSSNHWIESLNAAGIPCGPIYSVDQVFADPQVKSLGQAVPLAHPTLGNIELVASPINMEGVSKAIRLPTPELGEHTDELLASIGYDAAQIAALRARFVV